MPERLSPQDVANALAELEGWEGDDHEVHRSVQAPTFAAAIRLVDAVAEIAEAIDHHPDIDIRWTTISFHCSTHSAGGVTDLDIDLAKRIDDLAATVS